jgi:UDP-glucose 4-epimerase
MSKKCVVITGVAGLLGSRLADWIVENEPDVDIIGIDDLSGGYLENVNPKVNFQRIDLARDRDVLDFL